MAAPVGNKFWELRSKHGRNKLFETPELMWEAACEYFEWVEENPFIEEDFISSGQAAGTLVYLNKKRPFTIHALCSYLDCNTAYFRNFKNQERAKQEDFSSVITRIEETIYNQKFEGAASGFFNANIISRDLGIRDAVDTDHTTKGEKITKEPIIINWSDNRPNAEAEGGS